MLKQAHRSGFVLDFIFIIHLIAASWLEFHAAFAMT